MIQRTEKVVAVRPERDSERLLVMSIPFVNVKVPRKNCLGRASSCSETEKVAVCDCNRCTPDYCSLFGVQSLREATPPREFVITLFLFCSGTVPVAVPTALVDAS